MLRFATRGHFILLVHTVALGNENLNASPILEAPAHCQVRSLQFVLVGTVSIDEQEVQGGRNTVLLRIYSYMVSSDLLDGNLKMFRCHRS